jgi:xanthine dehydrogenase iron-sulfur cluster and FAD-binding subunit A
MMILGFCGLGFMAYRRKQNESALATAVIRSEHRIRKAAAGRLFFCTGIAPIAPAGASTGRKIKNPNAPTMTRAKERSF